MLQPMQIRSYFFGGVAILVLERNDLYATVLPIELIDEDWHVAKNGHRHSRTCSELLRSTKLVRCISRKEFKVLSVAHPRMKLKWAPTSCS